MFSLLVRWRCFSQNIEFYVFGLFNIKIDTFIHERVSANSISPLFSKIAISARESCSISPETVEVVEKCPEKEEEWTRAAARKNCAAYARYCSNPTEFVYHCVINSYINATLEVCAYKAYIVSGSMHFEAHQS